MKKNKKKKAFTLIELLAVIVILAIIALIVTVSIGRLLDNAKKETFKESAIGVLRSAELYMGKYVLENKSEPAYPMVFTCNGVECSNGIDILDISGKVPKSGSITMVNHKTVTANYLSDGKYCVAGTRTDLQVANSCADIDITKPTVSVEAEGAILKITMTDNESGIASYCVTTTNDSSTCNWIDTTDTYKEHEVEDSGTYYVFAKDKKGNVSNPQEATLSVNLLRRIILNTNPVLATDSNIASNAAAGLYSVAVTNGFGGADGTTYYFRGNVTNNYVSFAGIIWRIVRINEDGTIRIITQESNDGEKYAYSTSIGVDYLYYSNDIVKTNLETWYANNIGNTTYASKVVSGNYFCERLVSSYSLDGYNYSCPTDANNHDLVNTHIGLLQIDEAVRAGADQGDNYSYLDTTSDYYWLMTPKKYDTSNRDSDFRGVIIWYGRRGGSIGADWNATNTTYFVYRPVINLKANVTVTGTGTSADPYVVE